jgi:hypothetical protein
MRGMSEEWVARVEVWTILQTGFYKFVTAKTWTFLVLFLCQEMHFKKYPLSFLHHLFGRWPMKLLWMMILVFRPLSWRIYIVNHCSVSVPFSSYMYFYE